MNKFLQFFLGITFIVSAVSKLLDVDQFELYVFGLTKVDWDLNSVVIRLLISWELIIGIFLMLFWRSNAVLYATITTLLLFTGQLVYLNITTDVTNCNCFGNYLLMTPTEGIIKNIFLLVLAFWVVYRKPHVFKHKQWIPIAVILLSTSIPAIISPPDIFLSSGGYDVSGEGVIRVKQLNDQAVLTLNTSQLNDTDPQIVVMVSKSCSVCKKAIQKLSIMEGIHEKSLPLSYYFLGEDTTGYEQFKRESGIRNHPTYFLKARTFLSVTKKFPVIIFTQNDTIKKVRDYRSLRDSDLIF